MAPDRYCRCPHSCDLDGAACPQAHPVVPRRPPPPEPHELGFIDPFSVVCFYCGYSTDPNMPGEEAGPNGRSREHLIPRKTGHWAGDTDALTVTACRLCNSTRGDLPLADFIRLCATKRTNKARRVVARHEIILRDAYALLLARGYEAWVDEVLGC